ncbi:MAG TPA: pirin family protein [Clostridiales bacterium]|nr:pirin family protein [Clostridiales bacterium]
MYRRIQAVQQGVMTSDGAGVKLRRVFGYHDVPRFDPYLMLDYFDSRHPEDYILGFPWHPHRGIETITFLFSGQIEHDDSLGNNGIIGDGDCQWMTAGSGIIHQELPKPSPHLWGIQLWANLKAAGKMTLPRYLEITAAKIPQVERYGCKVRIIGGSFAGVSGAAKRPDIDACLLDVAMPPDKEFRIEKDPRQQVFALLAGGQAEFDGQSPAADQPGSVILYEHGPEAGGQIRIYSGTDGARFLLVSGQPIGEPVAWGGPIVMNTREELDLAFQEYKNGTFIKDQSQYPSII